MTRGGEGREFDNRLSFSVSGDVVKFQIFQHNIFPFFFVEEALFSSACKRIFYSFCEGKVEGGRLELNSLG